MKIIGVISLLALVSYAEGADDKLPDFVPPDLNDYNLTQSETNLTWGYNPWMPKYVGGDPNKTTFVMMTGGCIPVEEGGSSGMQDARNGWWDTCEKLGIECQCRPIIKYTKWNVPVESFYYGGIHHCSWEIMRILDEHQRGLIKLGGISAKCSLRNPEIYNRARELGVPVFLMETNAPRPGDSDYGKPEPDSYIGSDQESLGRHMARVLKQLDPNGGKYGFIAQWESPGNLRQRAGFNAEMTEIPSDEEDRPTWSEVERYPYERPYNLSVPCHHMTCQMEGLVSNTDVDSLVFLYSSPVGNSNYTNWVDSNRFRNLTLMSRGTVYDISLLSSGYLNGMVGEIHYDMGKRSAEILSETAMKLAFGQLTLPLTKKLFPTKFLSHSVIPLDLDETEPLNFNQNLLGNVVYVGYTAFGIVAMTALVCAIWTFRKRNETVVRAAQPFFLIIIVSGIVIFASTIIPLSFDDGGEPDAVGDKFAVGVCMSQPWLAFTGFSVIFSALFSKTWRVNRLFNSQHGRARVQVSKTEVLTPFAITFSFNVIVLACWTAFDPLTYTRLAGDGTDFWNREIETYGACRSDKALAFLLPLAVINMVVLGIACWQAFEGRNIESAFAESRYIGYSVASLFQAFLTGLPISVIVKDDPRAFYLVLMLMIFVLSEGILLLIFLPKMIMASTFARMSLTEQRKEISAQIKKSTVDPTSSSRSYQERGSKFFRALAPVKNVIRKLPENHEPIPEAVNGVGSNPDDPSGISDESKTTTRDLPSAVPCDSRTTNSESTTGSSGNGKCLDGAIGADPPAPMEDPGTSMSSEIHASTQDAPACPSENGGAPRSTAVSELTIHA